MQKGTFLHDKIVQYKYLMQTIWLSLGRSKSKTTFLPCLVYFKLQAIGITNKGYLIGRIKIVIIIIIAEAVVVLFRETAIVKLVRIFICVFVTVLQSLFKSESSNTWSMLTLRLSAGLF